jgi:hypothetical protein
VLEKDFSYCSDNYDCAIYDTEGYEGTHICAKGLSNPNFGITNFDTFGWSILTVF